MPIPSRLTPTVKPALAGSVAALVVGVSLAGGGYSLGVRAALAFLTWAAVSGGLLIGAFPRSRVPAVAVLAGAMLAADAVLAAASVAWAGDAEAAIGDAVLATAYLGVFALIVCVARERDATSWLAGLAVGIAAVGVLALLTRLIPALPGGDDEIARLLPSARGRLSYPTGYWNGTAALAAFGAVLLTWLAVAAQTRAGRSLALALVPVLVLDVYLASSRGGFAELIIGLLVLVAIGPRREQLLSSVAVAAIGAGLAIAFASRQSAMLDASGGAEATRQGWEVLAVTVACMLFAGGLQAGLEAPIQRLRLSRSTGWALVAAGVLAVAVAVAASDPSARFHDFKSVPANQGAGQADFISSHLSSGSGSGRWQFWGTALDAYADQPVRGIGAGGYENYWNQHAPITRVTKQAHSLYLEQLAELGIPGLVLVIGFLLAPPLGVLRLPALPGGEIGAAVAVVAAGALAAAIDWVWQLPAVFGVVVVALAVLAGPSVRRDPAGDAAETRSARRPVLTVAVVAFGCASLLLAGDQLLAKRSLDSSQAAVRDDDLASAADDARRAIALEPWASEPRLQLALVQEQAGDLAAAADSVGAAIDRNPDHWSLWLVRARVLTRLGRIAPAEDALARARGLDPRAPLFTAFPGPLAP